MGAWAVQAGRRVSQSRQRPRDVAPTATYVLRGHLQDLGVHLRDHGGTHAGVCALAAHGEDGEALGGEAAGLDGAAHGAWAGTLLQPDAPQHCGANSFGLAILACVRACLIVCCAPPCSSVVRLGTRCAARGWALKGRESRAVPAPESERRCGGILVLPLSSSLTRRRVQHG